MFLFVLVKALRLLRTACRDGTMRTCERASRGQEHLVDFERREEIYLVTRDEESTYLFPRRNHVALRQVSRGRRYLLELERQRTIIVSNL